jgi:hypothetical protein
MFNVNYQISVKKHVKISFVKLYHHLYHQNLHHTCSVKTRSGYFYTELKAAKFRRKSYEDDKNAYFSAKPPLIVPPKAVSPANV